MTKEMEKAVEDELDRRVVERKQNDTKEQEEKVLTQKRVLRNFEIILGDGAHMPTDMKLSMLTGVLDNEGISWEQLTG